MPGRLGILTFRPLSGKLKNISLSVLCGSAVKTLDPFRVNIKPPVLRVVVDFRTCKKITGSPKYVTKRGKIFLTVQGFRGSVFRDCRVHLTNLNRSKLEQLLSGSKARSRKES